LIDELKEKNAFIHIYICIYIYDIYVHTDSNTLYRYTVYIHKPETSYDSLVLGVSMVGSKMNDLTFRVIYRHTSTYIYIDIERERHRRI
jgi:hypothetical protein